MIIVFRAVFLSALVVVFLSGCRKNDPLPLPSAPDKHLLRAIEWNNGSKAVLDYNADSTLTSITSSFQNTASLTSFRFSGKKIAEMTDNESLRKVVYHYNQKGQVESTVGIYKDSTVPYSHEMRYTYNPNGSVATLNFYLVVGAVTTLEAISTYEYKSNGDLYKVTTASENLVATYVIDGYSAECDFSIYPYLDIALKVDYPLFNYPVLNTMKKLPSKITRIVKIGKDEPFIDHIEETGFTLTGKRIDKTVSRFTYPGYPAGNKTVLADYKY
ncbi:MAG TPA: hypothetical protein VEZ17_19410 [Chitinophagaceae bacterium]|jgi:hypothetical protein|nr:hypothetical protein [Chitinophagaceae bacterium]